MFDKKKIFSILAYAIGFFFWLAIFLLAVIREEPESHHWIFVARNAFEVLPAFVIYLILEFILYPIYKRNRKIARYTLSALMLLLLVSFLWAKIVQAHEPNNDRFLHGEGYVKSAKHIAPEPMPVDSVGMGYLTPPPPPPPLPPPPHPHHYVYYWLQFFIISLLVFAFFTTVHSIFSILQKNDERKEIEKMRAETELKLLKYQLNPHFLMNSLNNIHALIDIDTESAQESVRLLSKMMRYMLYETNQDKVELSKELDFMLNYFSLMRIRYIDKVQIEVKIPQPIPHFMVPPAIFINLAENGFKHGVSYVSSSFIHFEIQYAAQYVICCVRNSKPVASFHDTSCQGIGIESMLKRLYLLYGNTYIYNVQESDNEYFVELKIPIS